MTGPGTSPESALKRFGRSCHLPVGSEELIPQTEGDHFFSEYKAGLRTPFRNWLG